MNIRELASALKLSPSTVSKCLSGHSGNYNISFETVSRVRSYAAEVGYVPNHFAQKIFQRGDSGIIGILIRQDNAIYRNLPILHHVLSRLNSVRREYLVLSNLPDRLQDSLFTFKSMKIHDIIVIGSVNNYGFVNEQLFRGLRLYALDYYFGDDPNPHNYFCFRGGIDRHKLYLNLGRLLKKHGFFPFVCDSNCSPVELKKENLISPENIIQMPDNPPSFFDLGKEMCDLVIRRSCRMVLLHNDQIAIGMCNELLRRGIRVPDDIAVIGFNNSPYSDQVAVPLTTVALPILYNTDLVLDHLLLKTELPELLLTEPEIICRRSTPGVLNQYLDDFQNFNISQ